MLPSQKLIFWFIFYFLNVGISFGWILRIFVSYCTFPLYKSCVGRGRLAQWKNVRFIKVSSRQTVVQISPYAKSFSCEIYSQMHDRFETCKKVSRNLAIGNKACCWRTRNLWVKGNVAWSNWLYDACTLTMDARAHLLYFAILQTILQPTRNSTSLQA